MKNHTTEEYRAAAARLYGTPHLTVSAWGVCHRTEAGAFVEMMAWVPIEAVTTPVTPSDPVTPDDAR